MSEPRRYDLEGWPAIAGALGCTEKTARKWARAGSAPVWMWQRRVRAHTAELLAWFEGVHERFK